MTLAKPATRTELPPALPARSAIALSVLLAVNMGTYYLGGHALWSSVFVVFAELAAASFAIFLALGQWMTWCNIFLGLMALFHVGYFLPAKLGLTDENRLAPISGPTADTAMLLFAAAVLSFALGCSLARIQQTPGPAHSAGGDSRIARTVLSCGLTIVFLSFACGAVFVMQIGGPLALLHFTYLDYFAFFAIGGLENSRYAESFFQYFPDGLLLVYFGLAALHAPRKYFRIWGICTTCMILVTLLFGMRGYVILLLTGWAYLRHHLVRPLNFRILALFAIGLIIAIPWIATHRNEHNYDNGAVSDVKVDPLAPLVEMGLTYRSLYAMVEVLSDGAPSLNGRSYWEAIKRLAPLMGSNDTEGFQRTALWLNELVDPVGLAHNGTIGSSGVGEPFVNFGYPGVVLFFLLLGWCFSAIETLFLNRGSMLAGAMVTLLIVPMGFYVRDDISGTLRACLWPLLLLFALSRGVALTPMIGQGDERMIRNKQVVADTWPT